MGCDLVLFRGGNSSSSNNNNNNSKVKVKVKVKVRVFLEEAQIPPLLPGQRQRQEERICKDPYH